jgi:AcrR family transcriptional regulator
MFVLGIDRKRASARGGGAVRCLDSTDLLHSVAHAGMLMFVRALPGREARAKRGAPPAKVTRSSVSAEQRRRILRATGELVAKRGYADVTVELIVKRAHVSYKTFYKHFSNKEDCYLALFDRVVQATKESVRELLTDERDWAEQVVVALRTLTELIVADPLIAKAVIVEAPTVGEAIFARYENAIKALAPLLRAGRDHNPRGAELPARLPWRDWCSGRPTSASSSAKPTSCPTSCPS